MPGTSPGPHDRQTALGIMWGFEDSISAADDAFLAIIGYSRADLESGAIDWRTMTPAEYLHLDEAGIRQASETGGFTMPYQKEFIRKDGSRVPVLLVCAFIPDKPGHWMGYVVDLTMQQAPPVSALPGIPVSSIQPLPHEFHQRLVGELVSERTSMLAMLDSCDSPIWAVDSNFRLILANSAFQRSQGSISGRRMEAGESLLNDAFPAENIAAWRALYQRALRGERVTYYTAHTDGDVTHHHDHILMPMRDTAGATFSRRASLTKRELEESATVAAEAAATVASARVSFLKVVRRAFIRGKPSRAWRTMSPSA